MQVERIAEAAAFLDRAGPLLLEDEGRHNLVLGLTSTLRDHPAVYPDARFWVVGDRSEVTAAALRTPPYNLVLARPRTAEALEALADAVLRDEVELPGVTAAVPEAHRFAAAWEARTGCRGTPRMEQRVYRLTAVRPPAGTPGAARRATVADRDLLVSWIRAFAEEALAGTSSPAGHPERVVETRFGSGGGFVLWDDEDEPVSLAGWGGRTPNGVRIGPVYTPPERRRRGYGAAVTAAVSADQLAAGRRYCFLYTDLANATSNRIYTEIGYEPVCDSVEYAFDAS